MGSAPVIIVPRGDLVVDQSQAACVANKAVVITSGHSMGKKHGGYNSTQVKTIYFFIGANTAALICVYKFGCIC